MKKSSYFIVFLFIALLPALVFGENAIQPNRCIDVTYSQEIYYEYVYGNTSKLESSMDFDSNTHDNWHYYENLIFKANVFHLSNGIMLDFDVNALHKTDKKRQPISEEMWNLNSASFRLYGDYIGNSSLDGNLSKYRYDINIGTGSAAFTDYTIIGNIPGFGVVASWRPSCLYTVLALGGTNKFLEEKQYIWPYGGGRIVFTPTPSLLFGATFIHSEISWHDPDSFVTNYSNDVWSLDAYAKLLDSRLIIKAETAISRYTADRDDPASKTVNGWAIKFGIVYTSPKCLELHFNYEHQEPNFTSKISNPSVLDYSWEEFETDLVRGLFEYAPTDRWDVSARYLYRRIFLDDALDDFRNFHEAEFIIKYHHTVPTRIFPIKNAELIFVLKYRSDRSNDSPQSFNEQYMKASIKGEKDGYSLEYAYENKKNDPKNKNAECISHSVNFNLPQKDRTIRCLQLGIRGSFKVAYKEELLKDPDHSVNGFYIGINPVLFLKYIPLETMLTVDYTGQCPLYGEEGDLFRNITKVSLTQPIHIKNRYESSIVFSYENDDRWSEDESNRYGSGILKLTFNLTF